MRQYGNRSGAYDSDRLVNPEQSELDRALADRKTGDRAIILLVIGCLLLLPPLASVFQLDVRIFGIPFTGLYLFAVWGALIAGTAVLSKRLQRNADRESEERNSPADEAETVD